MSSIYNPKSRTKPIISSGNGSIPAGFIKSDISRVLPRQISTGALRGTQNVGYGGVQIDGSNNRIVLGTTGQSGSGTVGSIILDGANSEISVSDNISINGVTDAIIVTNTDGSQVGMGKIPDSTDFGFFVTDPDGNILMKIVGSTQYVYDYANGGVNVMQIMKLPDGSYGWAVASTGNNVSAGFS